MIQKKKPEDMKNIYKNKQIWLKKIWKSHKIAAKRPKTES